MRSTFLGFNTVRSGLFAAQRALDIIGHNVSNANTEGYTRQRLNQVQSTPMPLYGGQGMLGTGVDTLSITQVRNEFLDFKYRSEVVSMGYWEAKQQGLGFIEAIFNEPSKTGITTVMDELFKAFEELSKTPESQTTRALVREQAVTLTNTLNHMYNSLEKLATDLNYDVQVTVDTINTYADQIAALNDQIFRSEFDGSHANDLRDQRNLLIDQLSKLVNVDVVTMVDPNGKSEKLVLQINGQPLVYHDRANHLEAKVDIDSNFSSEVKVKQVRWANGDMLNVKALGGTLKGLLDIRDGMSSNNKGIPYYINELNRFAQTFAKRVNETHRDGFNLKGESGVHFFTPNGVATKDVNGVAITAKNIRVSYEVDTDLNTIAASNTPDLLVGDGSVALQLADLRDEFSMFQEGKPEDFLKSLISNLGVDSLEAKRMYGNQQVMVNQVDTQRMSISGVSMDEELSNMIRFQHAYNASARMMTTMDEMIDVIINKLGLVGR